MTPRHPGFLDEEDGTPGRPQDTAPAAALAPEPPVLPRGPMLLDPEPDAPVQLNLGWAPEAVATPRVRVGTGFWIGAGLFVLIASWAVLSMASFVVALLLQSLALGLLASAGIGFGCLLLLYAVLLEVRAYRSLGTVERLRAVLVANSTTVAAARVEATAWLNQLGSVIPDRGAVDRRLQDATTLDELRGVLRSQVSDRLRDAAQALGRRAAVEGATLVAICPHPAWDGVIAGGRSLLVIRRVAALYGLRPGLTVTLALMRRVAWTAAGTTGLSLVSQGLADHVLGSMPVLKHVAGALPGSGAVAVRLYRLAGITAETCSPCELMLTCACDLLTSPSSPAGATIMDAGLYILDGDVVRHEPDARLWADWMDNADRTIEVSQGYTPTSRWELLTWFLGVEMTDEPGGPFFFATRLVEGAIEDTMKIHREPVFASSVAQALANHARMLNELRPSIDTASD